MAEEEDLLGATVGRLLQITARNDGDASAETRQQHDRRRLQQLSAATTLVDTLVIVRFPAGDFVDCDGYKWETKEFFMDSRQLLATGSTVFAAQLSPEAQAQTRRCLEYDSRSYPYAKFVLDLTPPIEGVESASLVARLSLSCGLRDWWQSCYVSFVSKCLVTGHDDVCPKHFDLFLSGCNSELSQASPTNISNLTYPEPRKIVDYCPIRHRAAILRLLMAIRQGDLVLDSAPRTATMIVIARYFDCVKVVKDSVLTWFMSDPNQEFIQVNPEDALWMGWMAELRGVTRVAFRTLVVERAFEVLDNKRVINNNKRQLSILGRTRGIVADEQETCIQHAAHKLAQRVSNLYAQLMSDDVNIFLGIKQWPASSPALCQALRTYIRKLVNGAMRDAWGGDFSRLDSMMKEYDQNRLRYAPTVDLVPTMDIYLGASPQQRLLTCAFWRRFSESASVLGKLYAYARFDMLQIPQLVDGTKLEAQQPTIAFDRDAFHSEFLAAILDLGAQWTSGELEINVPRNGFLVLNLSDEEFKFLPLWAGGLDDGTGGVYQPDIPDAERGFPIAPGPSFCTGETIPDDRSSTVTDGYRVVTTPAASDTISMTSGRSIRPAPSQETGFDDELGRSTIGIQLAITDLNIRENMTVPPAAQMTLNPDDGLDWTPGMRSHYYDYCSPDPAATDARDRSYDNCLEDSDFASAYSNDSDDSTENDNNTGNAANTAAH